ncbi:integrin beta-like protein C [Corticium candelabrum]|uniref:integrin beta-like protein C n=1 Tax=Corticium candelabrum TaxID=121492 RepID=UPI002E2EC2BB|nr:integrin beta-like protein C [Corticium candelabrum]
MGSVARDTFVVLLLLLATGSLASHFRFGIITWKPDTSVTNKVDFQFKLAWRRSAGSFYCDDSTISSNKLIGGGNWNCASGCSGTVSSASYYCTSYSVSEDWSQGERTFSYTFSGSGPFTVRFSSCCWIRLLSGGSSWSVQTEIDLRRRSDNGKINSSPISATSAIIRLQNGCSYNIPIHTDDPDGDTVKCRWASGSSECGGVCNAVSGATLTSNPCTIHYTPNSNGWLAVALTLEDFASSSSSTPLSKVPLQFLFNVASRGTSCGAGVKFASSTLADNVCIPVAPGRTFTTRIYVTEQGSARLNEVTIVAPQGMSKSSTRGTSPNKYVDITWKPTTQQYGSHVFCFTAIDNLGIATSQRCITILAGSSIPTIVSSSLVPKNGAVISLVTRKFVVDFDQTVN